MRNRNFIYSLHSRSLAWRMIVACLMATTSIATMPVAYGAEPADYLSRNGQHRLFSGDMPPGALGQARLNGRGPVAGYFQPVAFSGPQGTSFALSHQGVFEQGQESLQAGMLIGAIYRFRITNIPGAAGAELFPTVEVIDRTYPPPGLATRYPIPVNLDQEDLEAALEGQMVTRVILLEDPQTAIALPQTPTTSSPIEIAENQDALEVADRFGRPVAIVRIGSVSPPQASELMPSFFFGYPTWAPTVQPTEEVPTQPELESQADLPIQP